MQAIIKTLLAVTLLLLIACEEEVPDYAGDLVGLYRVVQVESEGLEFDLSSDPIESAWFIELTLDEFITHKNDETICLDEYETEHDGLDGVTASSILFTDDYSYEYHWQGDFLEINDDYDQITLERYTGSFPPAEWLDDDLLHNDTYEPNNQSTIATAIASGGTIQNHYMGACGDYDFFMFSALEGKNYILETGTPSTSDLDLYLTLYSGSQERIDTADDQDGFDLNPRLEWTCENTGDYYFVIESYYYEEYGDYSVSVVESQQAAPSLKREGHEKVPRGPRFPKAFIYH